MQNTKWIMSEGGPLICLEKRLELCWGGIDSLTVAVGEATNDYERACGTTNYLESIELTAGSALIVGDAPLDTAFWRSSDGHVFMVRVWCCEEDFDVDAVMRSLDVRIFEKPEESLQFSFFSSDLVMFDSAEQGCETAKKSVAFEIPPGRYEILTQPHDPDPLTSLVLHRFDRLI